MDRRDFLKNSALAAGVAAAPFAHRLLGQEQPVRKPIGVILYTLRDQMKEDFEGTLRKVAEMGYPAVEFAGYFGRSAQDIRRLLDDVGLACCGAHEGIGGIENQTGAKCDFMLTMGGRHLTVPSLPGEVRKQGAEGYRAFGERLTKAGEKVAAAGCVLCYHNHSFEFEQVDGKPLYEYMLETADPRVVKLELDVFWAVHGGQDPAAYIRRFPGRFELLHMKDMAKEGGDFVPVGTGRLDMAGIVKAGQESGTQWYIVEQDRCQGSPFDAVAVSLKTLQQLL